MSTRTQRGRKKTVKHRKKKKKSLLRRLRLSAGILFAFLAVCSGCDYHLHGDIDRTAAMVFRILDSAEYVCSAASDAGRQAQLLAGRLAGSFERTTLDPLPEYSGEPYVVIDGNSPSFSEEERNAGAFERYSELDLLGRCGPAEAVISPETMPCEERGEIGQVRPSGWHTVKYEGIDGRYLYNRCHLIGYQLAGENANERNLITGTRYLNVEGMLPWENRIAEYVRETGGRVLYRVTPIFEGNNLVASGVRMEAESLDSDAIRFDIYVFNVQPGIGIDYADGESWKLSD